MMLGRVDEVDGNYVATRFVAGALPAECLYFTDVPSRATLGTPAAPVPLRTSVRSIALGYGRVWAPIAAAVVLGAAVLDGGPGPGTAGVAALLLVLSGLAHRAGRLSIAEKERLRLLGTVTGLRVDPSLLRPATRDAKKATLLALMQKGGIPESASAIVSVIDEIPIPALPLVYGYARYAGDDAAWQTCAEAVYRRHEEGAL